MGATLTVGELLWDGDSVGATLTVGEVGELLWDGDSVGATVGELVDGLRVCEWVGLNVGEPLDGVRDGD